MASVRRALVNSCIKLYFGRSRSLSYVPCRPPQVGCKLKLSQCPVQLMCRGFSTSSRLLATPAGDIDVKYSHGLINLSIPLPSRRERCVFTLLPSSQTIGDFVSQLQHEDRGTDHVTVYSADGDRLAKSTPIDVLLRQDFYVVVNDLKYTARVPGGTGTTKSVDASLSEVKSSISQLYSTLNVEEFQLERERELEEQLEQLNVEIEPFEQLKRELAERAEKRNNRLTWLGLGLMGLQFGLLARLTFCEYSWDIMEPVTYFVGYGSAVAMFGYYILTKQEYIVPDVLSREYLMTLHRHARKRGLDITRYNELKDLIGQTQYDLERVRDPLQLNLPVEYIEKQVQR